MKYSMSPRRGLTCALALLFAVGCGGSDDPADLCGNGVIDGLERCDDGNANDDDECNSQCEFSCGDGVLQASEECDTAIAAGQPGACPTACDDGVACTDDTLSGEFCQVTCSTSPVDFFRDGDGCCPDIGENNAFNDFDCMSTCGNGLVEMGETCDTAISPGTAGACPDATFCDDGHACTADAVVVPSDNMPGDGACRATCSHTEITAVDGGVDGCCPAGATNATDGDCVSDTFCGNGTFNPGQGETCDTAIAAGTAGACPTTCEASEDACFSELLVSAGTCSAECISQEINLPTNDDMCCPVFWGANNRNDNDCTSSCGTPAEECDEPGVGTCDTDCRVVRTGFRVTTIAIADPHIYAPDNGNGACGDLTALVNAAILPNAIKNDDDGNGFADLSWLLSFVPFDRGQATNPFELVYARCLPSPDPADTVCSADPLTERVTSTANNMSSGSCLDVLANTTTASYSPPLTPTGPCFVTDALNVDLQLGRIIVPLTDGFVAAEYDVDPATGLVNGLLRGFVSEAAAEATMIPEGILIVGGKKLSEILAGGITPGSCDVTTGNPIGDDRDVGPDGTTMGWYFYVNFTAEIVPYDDAANASTP